MLYDAIDDPGEQSPAAVRNAYEAQLRGVVDAVGAETAAVDSGVDPDRISAIENGAVPDLRVEHAAAILAVDAERPDAEAIVLELRDHLLMAMTTGVVDVDTLAANVDLDLSGQEVQQALEGRTEMTLEQLAAIHHFLAARNHG
ncbi:hypothetical protein GCM10008995_19160 [Halobellus salinus]|uniref:Uncharacterized protein n=1 Tax=Halobellus salinus TaxID=931585 RepID=A0A830EBN9_9EURY|nr:DUF5791 family protein [Halobellus salinus]GGJ09475.1 hypothetical protein GCM10008995_19160 [Halobellus salinus]SMP27487.1 hypothetical protein SAMN06265347_11290 [Halobellus salinus]